MNFESNFVWAIVQEAHKDQRYGKYPYFVHCSWVANLAVIVALKSENNKEYHSLNSEEEFERYSKKIWNVGMLHDIVEDTNYTIEDIEKLSIEIKAACGSIHLLTRYDESIPYMDYVQSIIDSGDFIAMCVKYADNFINYTFPKKGRKPNEKYIKSMEKIGKIIGCDLHENV